MHGTVVEQTYLTMVHMANPVTTCIFHSERRTLPQSCVEYISAIVHSSLTIIARKADKSFNKGPLIHALKLLSKGHSLQNLELWVHRLQLPQTGQLSQKFVLGQFQLSPANSKLLQPLMELTGALAFKICRQQGLEFGLPSNSPAGIRGIERPLGQVTSKQSRISL